MRWRKCAAAAAAIVVSAGCAVHTGLGPARAASGPSAQVTAAPPKVSSPQEPVPSAPPSEASLTEAKALIEKGCTSCHGITTTTDLRKSKAEWEDTVWTMIERGAQLSESEAAMVIDYLAIHYGNEPASANR